ncbi:MAG: OmpA family protein [Treponema sp.]|jgi:outer membrane protein OmpA-like peptidoglycan-associated protein/flagellar hook assembly protein FlgD|nr:OmpA family protein [Treponema sp.]
MKKKTFFIIIVILSIVIFPAFPQTDGITPVGANTALDLLSPAMAGRGGFITLKGGSAASAINPAAEGDAQRIIFDIGYFGLLGLGSELGYGNAASLGALFPTRVGVFGGSLNFIQSPFGSFPVGIALMANLNAAKELYPGMNVGIGLNFGFNTHNVWTVNGDLGFRYNMGKLGPLENFTWAVVLKGLGKSWIPSMVTPGVGVAFDFLRLQGKADKPDPLRMGFAMDVAFPTFQNVAGKVGINVVIADLITFSASSSFNLRETLNGHWPSPIPAIGIAANIKLKSGGPRLVAGTLPSDGELAIDLAAKPLYNNIWAFGAGLTWTVGVMDKNPPLIDLQYPQTIWISPNNDGKADDLEFPVSITDQRYVAEWTFIITDESGNVVRSYRNKERRPETQGVKNVLDHFLDVKSGVDVPATLRWDGILESGDVAPDGLYHFYVTAKDDNGNSAVSQTFTVMVDSTPPEVYVQAFAGDDNIFSPDGDRHKDTLAIALSGSVEDLWEAGIYDANNQKVKTFTFEDAAPGNIIWDGTNDEGIIVDDGVYGFRISSTDKAQNSESAELRNIIINTTQPQVTLTITDSWFSPNNDRIKDTMDFNLGVPIREGIVSWELLIRSSAGNIMRTVKENGVPPTAYLFDGRMDSGSLLREGVYGAELSVYYRNGYISRASSPSFTLDITAPRASIYIDDRDQGPGQPPVFSPNNTGYKDELFIVQEASSELIWTGEIKAADTGSVIRTFRFAGTPPSRLVWDGVTNAGSIAPDGFYVYELSSTDQAGNSGRSNRVEFEINTKDTPVFITTDLRAFSPNGDRVKDTITLQPQIQENTGILNWKIDIYETYGSNTLNTPSPQAVVKSFTGTTSVPVSVVWDGRNNAGTTARDGTYAARLDLEYRSGSRPSAVTLPFVLDTIAPQAETSVPFALFAPNGNGKRDVLPINISSLENDEWNAVISDSRNNIIRSWNWTGQAPAETIFWDGRDEAGNLVPDGVYGFALSSTDEAGNSTRKSINNITVDARIPRAFLTASTEAIAPKPNQASEAMRFNIMLSLLEGIDSWKLELMDETNRPFRTYSGTNNTPPSSIGWNGNDDHGIIREGRYTPVLSVSYTKGDEVTVTGPRIIVDISGPVLGFTYNPLYFSPDNDGVDDELFIYLSATDASPIANWSLEIRETEGTRQLFYRIEGRGNPPPRVIWDGRSNRGELVQGATDYSYTYRAEDTLGNASTTSGIISTDVLVIRDGDMLRIQVPSITFRANHADFIDLPQERIDNNNRVLRRVAEILNRFRDYRITVEGHANPIIGTAREETQELQPLSQARANAVIDILVGYGVSRNRLNAVGRGGTITVANAQDPDNNWKNRRVEFILIK